MFTCTLLGFSDRWCEPFPLLTDCQKFWTSEFMLPIFITLTIFCFGVRKLTFQKSKRFIYLCGGVYFSLYALYTVFLYTSKTAEQYFARNNSAIWIITSAIFGVGLLISMVIKYFIDE